MKQIVTWSVSGILQIASVTFRYSILLFDDVAGAEMLFETATCIVDVVAPPSAKIQRLNVVL